MIDKCVCVTSIIHLGKLALIMVIRFQNVGRYICITYTSVHIFRLIDICATVSNNCIDVMWPLHKIKFIWDNKSACINGALH